MSVNGYLSREKNRMFLELILLKFTFDYIYWFVIQDTYGEILILNRAYSRQAFSFDFNLTKYLLSLLFVIIICYILVFKIIKKDVPHEMIILGLIIISFFPNMTLFALSNIRWSFFLWQIFYWLWFLWCIKFLNRKKVRDHNTHLKKINRKSAELFFWGIAIVFVVGSLALSCVYYGEFYINLSFSMDEVYQSRILARGAFGTLTNYFRNNSMYVVLPLLSIIFLNKKRYLLFIINIIVLMITFSIDSQKAVLMLTLVSIIVAMVIKEKFCKKMISGMLVINILSSLFYVITENLTIVDYLFKRIYYLPAIIGRCHFDYVDSNQHIVLMSSLLTKLKLIGNYAYTELGLPFVIGQKYFGSSSISANTGSFAGTYDYGIGGMIVIPLVYAALFMLFDRVSDGMKSNYYISFVIVLIFAIEGATITSVLIVYGYFLMLILLFLMQNTNDFERLKEKKRRF